MLGFARLARLADFAARRHFRQPARLHARVPAPLSPRGATQDDGRLAILLTSGSKEKRLSGT